MDTYFQTKDLPEASLLFAKHKKLIKTNRDGKVVWFLFADKLGCEQLAEAYWQRDAVVNVREFVDAMRCLKEQIFNREFSEVSRY